MIGQTSAQPSFFGRSRLVLILTLVILFAGGLALRLTNLTAPPFDVHAWRQLRSASIARGMFYNLDPAANPDQRGQANYLSVVYGALEPPIFERLVAQTYLLLGQELLWVARLYSILFWLGTCLQVFFIARQITNTDGAVVALAFTLFL